MSTQDKPENKIIGCTCVLCGESLTAPIVFKGKTYGWTCITKINPSAKKPKKKAKPRIRGVTFECTKKDTMRPIQFKRLFSINSLSLLFI